MPQSPANPPTFAVLRTPEWDMVQAGARTHFESVVETARSAGASVQYLDLSSPLAQAIPVHRTIMAAEAHRFDDAARADGAAP